VTLNRFVLILFIAVVSSAGAQAAGNSTVDQLYAARQYELADAYWAAGQKFIDLGQADRGAEFQARAKTLFPGYVPGQAPAVRGMSVPTANPQLPAVETVREKNLQAEKVARLQFQKLLRGYLTGNAATIASASSPSQINDIDVPWAANSVSRPMMLFPFASLPSLMTRTSDR